MIRNRRFWPIGGRCEKTERPLSIKKRDVQPTLVGTKTQDDLTPYSSHVWIPSLCLLGGETYSDKLTLADQGV